jgi:Ketopantoate reductase PanE/ApbA
LIHVGIIGAGALGLSYGAALASVGANITLITHRPIAQAYRVKRRFHAQSHVEFAISRELVPCDVLLVALRAEDVDETRLALLELAGVPVVILSPLVSARAEERWKRIPLLVAAAPSLVASVHGEHIEYWTPPLQRTSVDDGGSSLPAVVSLVKLLGEAGIGASFERGVLARNRATTLAFFPMQRALILRPQVHTWRSDGPLRQRVATAFALARRAASPSKLALPPRLATWALSHSAGLWLFSVILPVLLPSLAEFLGAHFGHKLKAQTAMFALALSGEAEQLGLSPQELELLLLKDDMP